MYNVDRPITQHCIDCIQVHVHVHVHLLVHAPTHIVLYVHINITFLLWEVRFAVLVHVLVTSFVQSLHLN